MVQLLGNFGEFVGAIAVVATLAYLAVQIRQNTKADNALTYSTTATGWQDYLMEQSEEDLDILIQLSVNHHELLMRVFLGHHQRKILFTQPRPTRAAA